MSMGAASEAIPGEGNPGHWCAAPGPVARGLRIGLLGGSFNPAHGGHLHVSLTALKRLGLDYVWWLVSPGNPLKPAHDMTSFAERLESAHIVAHSHPRIVVTDIEHRLGTRYTVDTLDALRARFPDIRFVWLMGSDNLTQIPLWRDWRHIFQSVPVAVVTRPGSAVSAPLGRAAQVFGPARLAPSRGFAQAKPPAWTVLEARRHPMCATQMRLASLWPEWGISW
jgi:nicotinate-nucleotide adenylyltransferase